MNIPKAPSKVVLNNVLNTTSITMSAISVNMYTS